MGSLTALDNNTEELAKSTVGKAFEQSLDLNTLTLFRELLQIRGLSLLEYYTKADNELGTARLEGGMQVTSDLIKVVEVLIASEKKKTGTVE